MSLTLCQAAAIGDIKLSYSSFALLIQVEAVETSGEKRKRKGGKLKSKKMSKKLKKVPAVTS